MAEQTPTLPKGLWFGRGRVRTFAMVHRPVTSRGHGIVVCNALGFEGLIAHRPLRHLGQALAAQGHTVVRVDYEGTGDAPGPGHGPESLDAALDSIEDAIAFARDREGCTSVSLVGIRAGAMLAFLAARRTLCLRDLVLWAPCEKGSAYTRELKALARLSAASRPPGEANAQSGDRLEVVGFEFSPAFLSDLGEVDLPAVAEASPDALAERVLLLERDDLPASDDLAKALAGSGSQVDRRAAEQWTDFMVSDETLSVMPQQSINAIVSWFGRGADHGAPTADPTGGPAAAPHEPALVVERILRPDDEGITERTAWIDGRLFAIVTEPRRTTAGPRHVVVMPNTGSVNRTGPGRLYTHLARRWAALGLIVVRFDLGGTGDSPTADGLPENEPYAADRVDELLDVVTWASDELGADTVDIFGICSGAFQAFHAALRGADVRRIVLVNQAIFYLGPDQTVATSTSKAMMASHNMWHLRFVRSQVRRAVRSPRDLTQFWRRAWRGLGLTFEAFARRLLKRVGITIASRETLARDLDHLADTDVEVVFVFAAAEPGLHYLNVFGGETLARLTAEQRATVVEIDGGDHVFSPPLARREMADHVTVRLTPADPANPSTPTPARQA